MKWKLYLAIAVILLVGHPAFAQTNTSGNITAAGTTCATASACVSLQAPADAATITVQLTGTFSATLQFEQTVDGSTWVSASGVPQPSGASVTSATGTGMWRFVASGAISFRVRCSVYASGQAGVAINTSKGSSAGVGGGGAGSVTSVSGTVNQIGVTDPTVAPILNLTNPLVIPGQTTITAPNSSGVALDVTGYSDTSNIQNWRLSGGGIGAWVDYLGGIHGTSGDFGAGLGQGCLALYDPTGSFYVNHCGPNANLAANYELDDPAVASAGFLYFDGFQTTSWAPAPASVSNGLSSGGQVICSTSTLVCTISAATFAINGVQYASPQTDVTLVADGSDPTIDTFYVGCTVSAGVCDGTNVGIAGFIQGTPAGSPSTPSVDPTIELGVGYVTVAALATNASVTDETIYEDDAGPAAEWTMSKTGAGINLAGTTACYAASSKCIIGTAVTAGQFFKGVRGSGTVIPSSYNVLGFEIKSGGTWPKQKALNIAFYNGTTLVGNAVTLGNGSFAFNSSQTATYQQIAIAASLFNATTAVDTIVFTAVGGGAAFSWTVDHILLQSGITPPPPPTGGTVTQITAGTGLTGGTITTTGTIALATPQNTRSVSIVLGADNASSALANADIGPQLNLAQIPYAATVVEIDVIADGGTPNVIVQRNHLGTPTALLSSALATAGSGAVACSNTGGTTGLNGTTTCSNTLENTAVGAGDWIGLTSGTAGGVAKKMTIVIHYTVN